MATYNALLAAVLLSAALASCTPHGTSTKGKAAQRTVNCENGYTKQHRGHQVTPECAHNGAMSSP